MVSAQYEGEVNSIDDVGKSIRSGGTNGSRRRYTLRIPDRYRVLAW